MSYMTHVLIPEFNANIIIMTILMVYVIVVKNVKKKKVNVWKYHL